MKPKTDPKTGLTSAVMDDKDRRVLADAKDRALKYHHWENDDDLCVAAEDVVSGVNILLREHADGEEGGDDSGDSKQNKSEE